MENDAGVHVQGAENYKSMRALAGMNRELLLPRQVQSGVKIPLMEIALNPDAFHIVCPFIMITPRCPFTLIPRRACYCLLKVHHKYLNRCFSATARGASVHKESLDLRHCAYLCIN